MRSIARNGESLLIILSGALLALSFPNFNIAFFAYFAFVPLFFALEGATKREALGYSFLFGVVFFGITIFWLRHVSVPGFILLVTVLSAALCAIGPFFLYAVRRPLSAVFLIPAFWALLEYIRGSLFTGFPWGMLGYTQHTILPLIQISDITGAYGVSYIVMMANVAVYLTLARGIKKSLAAVIAVLLLAASALGYGYLKLNDQSAAGGESVRISLIQGDIAQQFKWDPDHKDRIFDIYATLTREAAAEGTDLVIWPETALPVYVHDDRLPERLKGLAKDIGTPLLIGAPLYEEGPSGGAFNSALLISPAGELLERYDKVHLVPFGEYIPFGKYIGSLRGLINKPIGDFGKGREHTVFRLGKGAAFGVLICFEDIFPGLVRKFTASPDGVDFMVNITNDAWFMKTAAPYQHAQSSAFRAVESRRPVVRAANTGLSCFIDKTGRITGTVSMDSEEIFVRGHRTKSVKLSRDKSFYTAFGDIFTYLCIIAVAANWRRRCSRERL